MVNIPTSKGTEFERGACIPQGMYKAQLKEVKEAGEKVFTSEGKGDRAVPRIVLVFELLYKEKATNIPFIGYLPATEGNKLGKALRTLGYKGEFDGSVINEVPLIGKQVNIFVKDNEKTSQDGEKYIESYAKDVLTLDAEGQTAEPAKPEAPTPPTPPTPPEQKSEEVK